MATRLILENTTLTECVTGILTGLYIYDNIHNIRIVNQKYPDYLIVPIEMNVIDSVFNILESELRQYEPQNVQLDQEIADFIVIKKTINHNKLTVSVMSLFELMSLSITIPDFDWNISEDIFTCYELMEDDSKIEEFIIKTDMQ